MELELEPVGNSGAQIVYNHCGIGILDLSEAAVKEAYRSAGVLLFRGFNVDALSMRAFAGKFSSKFNRDRLRPPVAGSDGYVQQVTEGMGYIEPHSEQANSPFRPDSIWFCCERPAEDGGETLYWDGVLLWKEFPEEMQQLFRAKKLRFFQRYGPDRWQLFLGPDSTLTDAQALLDGIEGLSYFIADDGSIYIEYMCSAVVRTKFCNELAFANGLLTEHANTLGDLMTFDDGTPVSDDIVNNIRELMQPLTEEIVWQPGDLAFVDNSRFLHGRNPYKDQGRKIYSCLSFLNF
ncbi:MAG: TauD/TfdA family dioxygenase [Pseudomonadota bacterium]